jgi:diadenosine tetraphosphatase ApaH/serine/threonine PP2A family protein phosphatase
MDYVKEGICVSLGDAIGYMPNPNDAMDQIWEHAQIRLIGNHEIDVYESMHGLQNTFSRNIYAQISQAWTAENLNDKNRLRLDELVRDEQYTAESEDIIFTHAHPMYPTEMAYIENKADAMLFFYRKQSSANTCFVGHTHIPKIFYTKKIYLHEKQIKGGSMIDLSANKRSLVVVPSVGQPRDGSNKAGYALFDSESKIVKFIRVSYDYEETQKKMRQNDFPPILIERIEKGW